MSSTSTRKVRLRLWPLILLSVGAIVVVLGWFVLYAASRGGAADEAGGPGDGAACRFTVGATQAFELQTQTAVQTHAVALSGPGEGADRGAPPWETQRLQGTLSWQVEREAEAGGWQLLLALTKVRGNDPVLRRPAQRAGLLRPFRVRIARSCRFTSFGFGAQVPLAARNRLQQLMQALEFVLPTGEPTRRWSARQHDSTGTYRAAYLLEAPAPAQANAAGPRLHRRRLIYTKVRHPGQGPRLTVQILASRGTFELDPAGRWARQIEGREHLKLHVAGDPLAEVKSRFTLRRLGQGAWVKPGAAAALRWVWRDDDSFPVERRGSIEVPAASPQVASLSLDEALAQFGLILRQRGTRGAVAQPR